MTRKRKPGTGSGSLGGFADRIERGSPLSEVCTSRRPLDLLRRIAIHASQERQRSRDLHSGARRNRRRGPVLFSGHDSAAKIGAVAALGYASRRNVHRIDLARVVSKYIGETEKNLRVIFDRANGSGAILFFDEADALFGRRGEVKDSHDRYANIAIGYFLGRMEAYRGLVIVSVGTSSGLSSALLRRVETRVAFPARKPSGKARVGISGGSASTR